MSDSESWPHVLRFMSFFKRAKAKVNLSFRVSEEFCGRVISYNCFYYNPRKCLHIRRK